LVTFNKLTGTSVFAGGCFFAQAAKSSELAKTVFKIALFI
jgi:hypothetical protein